MSNFSQSAGSFNPQAQNSTVLYVSVDTTGLNPNPPDCLGITQNGQGLLYACAGYTANANANATMSTPMGLSNTALSNIITNGVRQGDKNLNPTDAMVFESYSNIS